MLFQKLDTDLEPEFLFVEIRMLSLSSEDKPGIATLSLTGPLHPCLAKHFEDEEADSDHESDNENEGKGEGNQKKVTSSDSVGPAILGS